MTDITIEQLRPMLAALTRDGSAAADFLPGGYDEESAYALKEGSALAALQVIFAKAESQQPLNALEDLGMQVLGILANSNNWSAEPPPVIAKVRTEHSAMVRGTYTVDGSIDNFVRGLSLVLQGHRQLGDISYEVLGATAIEGGAGLNKVQLTARVKFSLTMRADDRDSRENILKSTRALFKHRSQPLPELERNLEELTTVSTVEH